MAKSKKSIWDVPQDEVEQAAKQVQQEASHHIPVPKKEIHTIVVGPETIVEPPKSEKVEKLQIIYVDTPHHTQAKINAAMRGMKLGKYIEFLIDQDKNRVL
ncbi:MAG: hypothetical protein JNL70_11335 [Saprospiraceae bacterium]|nr:hypothetical protein [Saprospiraceae bacterium]